MTEPVRRAPRGNKTYLYIGGAGAALFAAYMWHKRKQANAVAATAATDLSNIDPSTGMPYMDTGTSGAPGGGTGITPSAYSYIDPTTGAVIGPPGSVSGVLGPTSNNQWVQQAVAYLSQNGYDYIAVLTALGKYIAGSGLSDSEMGIVQAAIAAEGPTPKPVPAPHVNPPSGQSKSAGPESLVVDAYYSNIVTGEKLQVQNHTLYHMTGPTYKKLQGKVHFYSILPNWPGYKLPHGGSI
jgi:hypothetical protein